MTVVCEIRASQEQYTGSPQCIADTLTPTSDVEKIEHRVYNEEGIFFGKAYITSQSLCHGDEISRDEVRLLVISRDEMCTEEEFLPGAYLRWKRELVKKDIKRKAGSESVDDKRKRVRQEDDVNESEAVEESIKIISGKTFKDFQCEGCENSENVTEETEKLEYRVYNDDGNFIGKAYITSQSLCHGDEISRDEVRLLVISRDEMCTEEEFLPGAYLRWKRELVKKAIKRKASSECFDEKRKRKRNSGESYETRAAGGRKKLIPGKIFKNFQCECRFKSCFKISSEERENLFKEFWKLGDYDAQNYNLLQRIKVVPKKSVKLRFPNDSSKSHPKNFSREYYLNEVQVCKEVFINTFGISSGRIDRLLKKKKDNVLVPTDGRGKHANHPTVSNDTKKSLEKLIQRIPKYKTHYKQPGTESRYLSPGVTKLDIYELWKEECLSNNLHSIPTYEWFLTYWKANFDLKVHVPSHDCCATCDELSTKGDESELAAHHEEASKAREVFREDSVKRNTFTFDMQKTQPLPHLQTNKVFYLRQLWLYNLGIHHTIQRQGYMYCWTEGTAKRGSNEVGSCLKKFIVDHCQNCEEIILWSDSCGGQNRNFNIMAFLLSLVNDSNYNINKITHRFMWSGHSYLPNDADFSHIEKRKKTAVVISNPEQYLTLIQNAKKQKPFYVHKMKKEDFVDISKLASNYAKPRVDDCNNQVKISKMHEMIYSRGFVGYTYRNSFLSNSYHTVPIRFSRRQKVSISTLPNLHPSGVPISLKKFKNLQELLKYIPPIDHEFYTSLPHEEVQSNNDDIFPDK